MALQPCFSAFYVHKVFLISCAKYFVVNSFYGRLFFFTKEFAYCIQGNICPHFIFAPFALIHYCQRANLDLVLGEVHCFKSYLSKDTVSG